MKPWQTWAAFGGCVALVFTAMALVSARVVDLDAAEAEARVQAEREGLARLALWRVDSLAGPILAAEAAQPYFAYSSFYPADRAYTRMFNAIDRGEVLVASPLLVQRGEAGPVSTPHATLAKRGSPPVSRALRWCCSPRKRRHPTPADPSLP